MCFMTGASAMSSEVAVRFARFGGFLEVAHHEELVDGAAHESLEAADVEGLAEEFGGAFAECFDGLVDGFGGGGGEDGAGESLCADLGEDLEAAYIRKVKIEEEDVGAPVAEELKALASGGGVLGFDAAHALEGMLDELRLDQVVLDHEKANRVCNDRVRHGRHPFG
jgi:hypothetical protein